MTKHKSKQVEKTNADDAKDVKKTKTPRKRKRHHYNSIRDQMEFYFGDANLSKDRFLRQLIEKDEFVPLDVFLTFNKMKSLADSTAEIAKSLTNSKLLELDEMQQRVRRMTALPTERNVDEKTIYVEALPAQADHDWVRRLFERFGPVTYVSLPKYIKSRRIKEFGFIEFAKESSVAKAIAEFETFNGVLNTEESDPAELTSIKSFVKEEQMNNENQTELNTTTTITDEPKSNSKKRKKETDSSVKLPLASPSLGNAPPSKRLKKSSSDIIDEMESDDATASSTNATETDDPTAVSTTTSKKKKRRKKMDKKAEKKLAQESNLDSTYYNLKILTKPDWKRLRNKYLNMQRERKRQAWKDRQHFDLQQSTKKQQMKREHKEEYDVAPPSPVKKSRQSERRLQKMNMNFYGAAAEEEVTPQTKSTMPLIPKETKRNPALERTPLFTYAPGVIVEVGIFQPCVDTKEFKADMRQYAGVKYVDIKEGATHANIRMESSDAANQFVGRVNCAEYVCKVLSGEREASYWQKIEEDREMKLNKQVKLPHKRGRERIKKIISKHTHFGDND